MSFVRPHRGDALVGVAVALLVGCTDAGPETLPECAGPVTLSVSAGTTPLFAWTPACRLNYLVVKEAGLAADIWAIVSDSANAISPDVRYGTVPPGVREHEDAAPLLAGVTYNVAVGRWTGSGVQVIGVRAFTP